MRAVAYLSFATVIAASSRALAVDADPSNYQMLVQTLKPGDTMKLAAGMYGHFDISGVNGTAGSPITIVGPTTGTATFTGDPCCNVVELTNTSYLVIKGVTIDSAGLDGVFGLSAKGGAANATHDITVEDCSFKGQGASQQTDAISTKTPTWGWIIRRNVIDGAGTGMYLGNSTGDDPFVVGVIENNLIKNTIGYNIEIKFQNPWPAVQGLPTTTTTTILRNNVFIKNDAPSPDGDRPNVLVGGFPSSGPGSTNAYEIYGNFFFHNPRESLLQASGRVSIHDNIFVDASDIAMNLRDHDLPLELAHVYNNTVFSAKRGVHFGNAAAQGDLVILNLVFADTPIDGPIQSQSDNITDVAANAGNYVNAPSTTLGMMDFYPLPGKATGPAADVSAVKSETDYAIDFNGTSKGMFTFRGAYSGEGKNPGWQLGDGLKMGGGAGGGTATSTGSAGAGPGATAASATSSATTGAGGGVNDDGGSSSNSGCGCEAAGAGQRDSLAGLGAGLIVATMTLRRRRARPEVKT